jgi:hypothetical protein
VRVRLSVVVVISLISASAVAALSETARGSGGLGVTFSRATAQLGDSVAASGVTQWSGSTAGITAYLTSTRLRVFRPNYNGIQPILLKPPAHGVWRLGGFSVRHHRLFIRFSVPKVPPGDYTVAFQCGTCSPGGDFLLQTLWGEPWSGKPGFVLRVVH